MRREALTTEVRIRPKIDEFAVAVGSPNEAVFVRLRASTRKSRLYRSENLNFFESDASVWNRLGPMK
jgi:hypothetical protein